MRLNIPTEFQAIPPGGARTGAEENFQQVQRAAALSGKRSQTALTAGRDGKLRGKIFQAFVSYSGSHLGIQRLFHSLIAAA